MNVRAINIPMLIELKGEDSYWFASFELNGIAGAIRQYLYDKACFFNKPSFPFGWLGIGESFFFKYIAKLLQDNKSHYDIDLKLPDSSFNFLKKIGLFIIIKERLNIPTGVRAPPLTNSVIVKYSSLSV